MHTRRPLTAHAISVFCLLLSASAPLFAAEAVKVSVLPAPPVEGGNSHYAGNREPLMASPLVKLPIGAIRPEGWVRGQLELMAEGMVGKLTEISPWCDFESSAWTDPQGEGERGWEELPYWLKGFIDLGYVLGDERIIKEANRWLDAVIASQRPDGYFGGVANRKARDVWPHMVMLYAVRSLHEATGDERVIPFMLKYFKWQSTIALEDFLPGSWQKWRGGDNLDNIHWLYNRTGEKWLLELARTNHDCTANWKQEFPTWHGVNICECFREPAQYAQQAHDPRYIDATRRLYNTVTGLYGQVPGGMFGADENARAGYRGPRQAAESCSMVEFMYSFESLLKITGEGIWADRCEDVVFNSLPAAMTPDFRGLHYLTAPNQIKLDKASKSPMIQNGGDMFSYSPYEQYRCCQHNIAFGWPYYAEHLWLGTAGNGLAAALYAPCSVKAKVGEGKEVSIRETTDYPFGDTVKLEIAAREPVRFPLMLRVPGWCDAATVSINGKKADASAKAGAWIVLDGTWRDGDVVELRLPMEIRTRVWKDNGNTVSVDRGPLTYSLKIGEKWAEYDTGRPWKGWEVFPTTPWNYGLVVETDRPTSSFEVVRSDKPVAKQPFTHETAPIALKARGKRIPQWKEEVNGLVGEIRQSPLDVPGAAEEITLIPMGCARLRISAFPHIVEGGPAIEKWADPGLLAEASFVPGQNPLTAIHDGIVPKASNDTEVPRFTWWDRRGTGEWVQYTFTQPRTISSCEVYWFDDTGSGKCRVPIGWRLIYRDGRTWKSVPQASGYGTEKDTFNKVAFPPITTSQLRLIADMQPEHSAGILEWRVGE